jgi:DNA polymerase-3 subunit beta
MGVYLKVMDNELRMVATDGHRLVKIVNTDFSSPGVDNESIIPTKALNLLLKNIGDSKQIKVDLAANHIIFEMANTRIISKGIEGQFPSYERVIPIDNDKTVVVDRELLASSVRRVSIFSNTITHQIRVSLTNGAVKVQCEDVEFGGEARETVDADYPSEEMDIGYNANYLLDILRHLETDEIDIRVKNPVSAAVFFPHTQNENEEILMLLMPIRLNED